MQVVSTVNIFLPTQTNPLLELPLFECRFSHANPHLEGQYLSFADLYTSFKVMNF